MLGVLPGRFLRGRADRAQALAVPSAGLRPPLHSLSLWCILAGLALCCVLAQAGLWKRLVQRLPAPALGLGYTVMLLLALVLAPGVSKTFIYFQF